MYVTRHRRCFWRRVQEKYSQLFSGAAAKVKSALFVRLSPALSNDIWDRDFMMSVLNHAGR